MRPLGRANCRRTHARRRGWPVMTRQITTATSSRSRPCPGTVSAGWRTSAARVSGCKAWAWVSRRTNWGTITACGTRIFGMPPSMPAWSGRGRTWSTATFTIRWDLPEPGVTSSTRRTRASWTGSRRMPCRSSPATASIASIHLTCPIGPAWMAGLTLPPCQRTLCAITGLSSASSSPAILGCKAAYC